MDLDQATLLALDWTPLLHALSEQARTSLGARAVLAMKPMRTVGPIQASFDVTDEVLELWREGMDLPVGEVADIRALLVGATKGEVLDITALRQVRDTAEGLDRLRSACAMGMDDRPLLAEMAAEIYVDPMLQDELLAAFDNLGQLSAHRWPELGELREAISGLHASIRKTLDNILKDDSFADLLQDSFVTQRRDRYVVPVKAHAKRWDLGIVHGTSGSGATAFIEPNAVVEANNRLKIAEGQLEALERRIMTQLSRMVAVESPNLERGLQAATAIDVVFARAGLARLLNMNRPAVTDGGAIRLKNARHPVLALRNVPVVANDLSVGDGAPVLVLSGPNAGGKTVALKTLGLCALLIRWGCFVPADEGSRVDVFHDVLADIGDSQTIDEDLSSFTGQLAVLNAMLGRASAGSLLLLDEIATGTDPTQGAALAAAVVEALCNKGATVVATTHYAQLKGLAATDDRFSIAAVEHGGGQPTYKVVAGATGESHGLEVAGRVGMDPAVLARARHHMGDSEAAFTRALEELDAQRDRLRKTTEELDEQRQSLAKREKTLAAREATVAANAKRLEEQAASGYRSRLANAEDAISSVVAELQRAPDHAGVAKARATLAALKGLAPQPQADEPEDVEVEIGDHVRLRGGAKSGEVLEIRGEKLTVRMGGMTLRVNRSEVERTAAPVAPKNKKKSGKKRAPLTDKAERRVPVDQALRLPNNTLDLRGQRVDEALDLIDRFLDDASRARYDAVFVLHGHGTGAMKKAVRQHLRGNPYIQTSSPANADQGGDAYTVGILK